MKSLFGKSLKRNYYNYCPSLLIEDDKLFVWYCTNKISGNITDYIGFRTAIKDNGLWKFSKERLVLEPSKDKWDARHTCDPSVIKGVFSFNKITYNYLMAYLGCVTDDCKDNEVGLAFSETIKGPWHKLANPIANYLTSPDCLKPHTFWGYGQPSLLSFDKRGKVLLFYTVGLEKSYTKLELWDFSDLANPLKLRETILSNEGYLNSLGKQDSLVNADFAYDFKNKILYAVSDTKIRGEEPSYISNEVPVLRADLKNSLESLFEGNFSWKVIYSINQSVSTFPKNHNPGLVSDSYGYLRDSDNLDVAYTVSDLNKMHLRRKGIWSSLATYRVYLKGVILNEKN
ncbi:MAG: hypothetical protein LBM99_06415 [Bacillales bacterium]|jgi:hypothetical protein|nr:hypothetical protein [Bacillales bacterium]